MHIRSSNVKASHQWHTWEVQCLNISSYYQLESMNLFLKSKVKFNMILRPHSPPQIIKLFEKVRLIKWSTEISILGICLVCMYCHLETEKCFVLIVTVL